MPLGKQEQSEQGIPEKKEGERKKPPLAILVNGPSSSGKTTFCRALQERLAHLASGHPDTGFARVAFDDVALLMAQQLYPISYVKLKGGDVSRLVSRDLLTAGPVGNISMRAAPWGSMGGAHACVWCSTRTVSGCFWVFTGAGARISPLAQT